MDSLRRSILCAAVCFLSLAGLGDWHAKERWFYFWGDISDDGTAARFNELAKTAHNAGYNGVLLECFAGNAFLWDGAKRDRYRKELAFCASLGLKVVPSVWSIGYGSMLKIYPDLVETSPINDLPYVVRGGKIVFAGEEIALANAGMEDSPSNGRFGGWETDEPGNVCFTDSAIMHGGRQSARFEPGNTSGEHARIFRKVELAPFRRYRLSVWVRVDEAGAGHLKRALRLAARGGGETLVERRVSDTDGFKVGEWQCHTAEFYVGTNQFVHVYAGAWNAIGGRFWLDDIRMEVSPLTKVPRGAGAPFRVRNAHTGKLCVEGVDYLPPPRMTDWRMKPGERPLVFAIPTGSFLKEGDELKIDAAIPSEAHIYDKSQYGQYAACMSDPALYDYFERSAAAVEDLFHPDCWMLSMDEIRAGGTCEACRARHTDMAHILGDCITRQTQAIRRAHPGATVYVWSDMLDPVHNAQDGYYSCLGTFEGAWNFIPKDIVLACWWRAKRDISLPFFESRGFRTLAAAYYDANDLSGSREWLESCRRTPHCLGLMYTTWRAKYDLLQAFGEMVSK